MIASYLLSIPLALTLVAICRSEGRNAYEDCEGGWWASILNSLRWGDVMAGIGVGLIPVLNTVASVVMIVATICFLWQEMVGDLLSKPVFSRKVVIKMKKD